MLFTLDEVHLTWRDFFSEHLPLVNSILSELEGSEITPKRSQIFRAFIEPLDQVKIVIFGQDPYPESGVADGLAFSTYAENRIPGSLRNIFKEYSSDLDLPRPLSPDLSRWSKAGVLLLNRTLTTTPGSRNAHLGTQWRELTNLIAVMLAERNIVAILWGSFARELAPLFSYRIESAHPSPLSAHRGFIGSRPFSGANKLLMDSGHEPVDWRLE